MCETINVRCLQLGLSVTRQVAIAKVVRQNKHNIWSNFFCTNRHRETCTIPHNKWANKPQFAIHESTPEICHELLPSFSLLPVVVDCGELYPIEENPPDATQFFLFNHFCLFYSLHQHKPLHQTPFVFSFSPVNPTWLGQGVESIHLVTTEKVHSTAHRKLIYQT